MAMIGRGLWYGASDATSSKRVFTEAQWHDACSSASAWGISILHPKVADGGYLWYDVAGLQMLKSVADSYHLQCVPYHYCYGDTYGALAHEAQICAGIGGLFGGVSPDIEHEWERPEAAGWATRFGQLVKSQYTGPIYPTVFANPLDHPLPWGELNQFSSAFFPQVYFSLWSPPTAIHAYEFIYPQWETLDQRCRAWGNKKPLVPMLPIINLDGGPLATEVIAWLTNMQYYEYCGFWYDGKYAPYAQSIINAPKPMPRPVTPPAKPPPVVVPSPPLATVTLPAKSTPSTPTLVGPIGVTTASSAITLVASPSIDEAPTIAELPVVRVNTPALVIPLPQVPTGPLTSSQLLTLWNSVEETAFDGSSLLEQYWCQLVQKEIWVGAPLKAKKVTTLPGGEVVEYLSCQSSRTLIYFHSNNVVVLF